MPKRRPVEIDDLFSLQAIGAVTLSPDGQTAVYEVKRFDLAENRNTVQLWRIATGAGEALPTPTPLTAAGKHADRGPKFSPDGRKLAFVSTRDKGACLFVLDMDGGEPRRLTTPDGFVHDFNWSPDSRRLVYSYHAMNERERLERDGKDDVLRKQPQYKHITRAFHKLDGAGWWNGEYRHLYSVPAEGGRPRQLTDGDFDDSEPTFSPDGKLVSFMSNRLPNADLFPENADIFVVPAGGGAVRQVTRKKGAAAGHAWTPDGKAIVFVGNPGGPGERWRYPMSVFRVPATGGKPVNLTPTLDLECYNLTISDVAINSLSPANFTFSADGRRVHFCVSKHGAANVWSCALAGGDVRQETRGEQHVLHVGAARRDRRIALVIGTATNPADLYLADPQRGWALTRLTAVNQAVLDRLEIVEPEMTWVKSGRTRVQVWTLRPPRARTGRRSPALLLIHGGPQTQYGSSFIHEMQWLASQGYVVCFSNPRGSAGYGLKFMNAIHQDWGNLDHKDIMAVTDWLARRPCVDARRMGITGGSYGGYMTNWVISRTNRFKAAVTQRSVVSMESLFGTSDFGPDLGNEMGGKPWENVERLRRCSPLTYVANIRTPLLIEHQEQDYRCPIEQAEQLFTALKVLGRTVEMIRFEGESHGMSRSGRPQNRAERLRRIGAWFAKYLR